MKKILPMKSIHAPLVGDNSLNEEIEKFRMDMFHYDKNLLTDTDIKLSLKEFNNAPDGRFIIPYKTIDFDCLFKRDHVSNRLYVIFNGSRPANSSPVFKRWSYYKYMNGSMLNIDDPMYKLYRKLVLGWYYGTETENYCDYVVEIVEIFAKQNGFKDIVFFASSGGGYAALYCACKIDGSMAVAINPQIDLSLFPYSRTFETITGLNLNRVDKFGRNNLCELIANADHSKFLLINNCESPEDMVQLNNLLSKLDLQQEVHYGLSELKKNIICWIYQAKDLSAHNAQEYPAIFWGMEYLIDHFNEAEHMHDFILLLNELWYDRYEVQYEKKLNIQQDRDKCLALFLMMNEWVKVKQDGKNLVSYFEKNGYKRIAIYGMSHVGKILLGEINGTSIQVAYGIDQNADEINAEIDILSMGDDLEPVDAVVVSSITFFDEIKEKLGKKIKCPIISLKDILAEV